MFRQKTSQPDFLFQGTRAGLRGLAAASASAAVLAFFAAEGAAQEDACGEQDDGSGGP
jgi:hypothetical protein